MTNNQQTAHPTYGWQTATPTGRRLVVESRGTRVAQCNLRAKVNGPRYGETRMFRPNLDDDGKIVSWTGVAINRAGDIIGTVVRAATRDDAWAQMDALVAGQTQVAA